MKKISRIRIIEAPRGSQLGENSMALLFGGAGITCTTFDQCSPERQTTCGTYSEGALCDGTTDPSKVKCGTYATTTLPDPPAPELGTTTTM